MDADEIVRKLAAQPAPLDSEYCCCRLCDVEIVVNGLMSEAERDRSLHDDECPWRLAVEYVAERPESFIPSNADPDVCAMCGGARVGHP